ncbi:MAG: MBL fold metallo-hydrolase [Dactylosporangium sp.]|nr:MBL fold metallo-hydrolase [Dactylosporangium sp.]NNJ60434.1 MBL fold metallo-hydrolase [Dactylosporangium sp.]
MSADVLFANAPAAELPAALARHHLRAEPIVFEVHPLLVETGTHRVLVDPGGTDDPASLRQVLRAAGIDPASIDTVVLTHGHADHYIGCVGAGGGPAFPDARHVMRRVEWDHWLAADNPEPHHAENFLRLLLPLRECFTLLDGESEIVPGIEVIPTPGHSPGHLAVKIGGSAIHVGDVLPSVVYVEHPDWYARFDVWPDQVVDTRRKLLRQIAESNLMVFTHHFEATGAGRVVASADGGWRWVPA